MRKLSLLEGNTSITGDRDARSAQNHKLRGEEIKLIYISFSRMIGKYQVF